MSEIRGWKMHSFVSYAGEPVPAHEISKTIVFKSFFSIVQSLNRLETQALLLILSDPKNYNDQPSTSNSIKGNVILTYYNRAGLPLGESYLTSEGELQTTGVEVGGSGYLSCEGSEQLKNIVN
ncbi:MAG: hypothetical protein WKF87_02450 [Chryseolinea sp.]